MTTYPSHYPLEALYSPDHERDEVNRLLPLSHAATYIGLALAESSPMHGYAIMKEINGWPHPSHSIGTGNLYRTLPIMVSHGLIEETEGPSPPDKRDKSRRYYRITDFGEEVCLADLRLREYLLDCAKAMLGKEQ